MTSALGSKAFFERMIADRRNRFRANQKIPKNFLYSTHFSCFVKTRLEGFRKWENFEKHFLFFAEITDFSTMSVGLRRRKRQKKSFQVGSSLKIDESASFEIANQFSSHKARDLNSQPGSEIDSG